MAPKSRVRKKTSEAGLQSADLRKKQRVSSESGEATPTSVETLPSSTASGLEETPAIDVASVAGPSSRVMGTSVTGPSTSSADLGAGLVGMGITGSSASLESVPASDEATTDVSGLEGVMAADPESSSKTSQDILGKFVEDWLETLDKEEIKSVSLFLCYHLVHMFSFTETRAAEHAANMVKKSDRSVRRWRSEVIDKGGVLPESQHGRYQRSGVLRQNEELNKKAREYVRANAAVKGRPNLTSVDFCKWVNESFLPNCTLEPGFPWRIGVETARLWLHHLGFEVLTARKGIFIDGHERPDVIETRTLFLRKMIKLGFLHFTNAPTEDAMRALPDVDAPTNERRLKTVVLFHNESTFMANEDQPTQWGMKGEKMMKPKSKGAGVMVSDFIDEHNGLALSDDEHEAVKASKPHIRKYAREFLEYGESREGYWTRDRFIAQMHQAIEIAEIKYPKEDGWRHVWVFDHSSCHAAMADNTLDVSKMNVKPGGKQRMMRDTTWNGRVWKMYYTERDGRKVAKGLKMVLEERGVSTVGKMADWMRQTLAEHSDFKDEKSMIEHMLMDKGHVPCFLPKFHPELNRIERVWAQLKRFTKAHCKYSLPSLRKNIPLAYDSVTVDNICNHFRKVRHYMFGYLEGLTPGKDFDQALTKYKTAVKSDRRIGINE